MNPGPVPLMSLEEDASRLRVLAGDDYQQVLVVSDLHLGVGRDRWTGTYPITENFYADDAFAELLESIDHPSKTLLVLNGDTFDFLRITDWPRDADALERWRRLLQRLQLAHPPLETAVSKTERTFGLKTNDYKSIWKLALILDGHAVWWQALRRWVITGGNLIFVKGNHDLELHWPSVRRFLRDRLVSTDGFEAVDAAAERRIGFAEGGFTVGNIYIEHGHQYERMTRVDGPVTRPGSHHDELTLPLGSFVNRYFINRLERLDPFLDNIKPVQRALMALLRRRPIELFRIYQGGWRFMFKTLTHIRTPQGAASLLLVAALFVPLIVLVLIGLWIADPDFRVWLVTRVPALAHGWARVTASLGGLSLPTLIPYAAAAIGELLSQLGLINQHDPLAEGAVERLRERFGPAFQAEQLFAVMGHTHTETVLRIDAVRPALYVNTGTWIGQWPEDRLDLIGKFVYSVARFTRARREYTYDGLVWDDEARSVRSARILVPVD